MADWLDKASELEQQQRSQALAACTHATGVETAEVPGHCNDCGEAISRQRLAALPEAATCIDCQTLREQRGRRG